jgi:hypothetical protein
LIVSASQIAAPLRHGYATESTVSTRLVLVNGTRVPMVIACKVVLLPAVKLRLRPLRGMFCQRTSKQRSNISMINNSTD